MCDINESFKLCACSGKVDKSKSYWTLERSLFKKFKIQNNILIDPALNTPEPSFEYLDFICDILNDDISTFNFDFVPMDNDLLTITINQRITIDNLGSRWTFFPSDFLTIKEAEFKKLVKSICVKYPSIEFKCKFIYRSMGNLWYEIFPQSSHSKLKKEFIPHRYIDLVFGWTRIFYKKRWCVYNGLEGFDMSERKEIFSGELKEI